MAQSHNPLEDQVVWASMREIEKALLLAYWMAPVLDMDHRCPALMLLVLNQSLKQYKFDRGFNAYVRNKQE